MNSWTLLKPCFLAIFFLAWIRSADGCDVCDRETITDKDAEGFEKVKYRYEEILPRKSYYCDQDRKKRVKYRYEEILPRKSYYCDQDRKKRPMELEENNCDICPSETVSAEFWRIPNMGYECWIVDPVSYTNCTKCGAGCQDSSVCETKCVYEYVCSFCVKDDTKEISFQLIEVPIPKCCACT